MKEERRVPIWTTLPTYIDEQIERIAKNRGWTRPQTVRHLLMNLLDPALSMDKQHGEGYVADNLQINTTFGQIQHRG